MTAKTTIEGYNPNENPIKRVEWNLYYEV
jgi:hypothetical protein